MRLVQSIVENLHPALFARRDLPPCPFDRFVGRMRSACIVNACEVPAVYGVRLLSNCLM